MTGDWPSDRLETTWQEARCVIEAQNRTMSDIDNKAIQSVRFNTILVGLLLAAANAADTSIFEPFLLTVSIVLLVISIVCGLITYNESDLYVGPKGEYIEDLVHNRTADPWHEDLLETFSGMIGENADEIDWNSRLLTLTQGSLVLGIIAAILSIGI